MFLSTPHRGSSVTPLLLLLANMAKILNFPMSGFTGNIRTDMVHNLGRDSDLLNEISKLSRSQMEGMKIASCYEKAILKPLNTVVSFTFHRSLSLNSAEVILGGR
jgi:hypothetical protein